jgi:MFS family permease
MQTDKATKGAWYALGILFGINLMNFYDRQIMGALAELIRKEWALNDALLGTLSTAFILMYAAVGLPLGRLADTWSRRKILAGGVSIWSVLTAVSGLAPSFGWMFVSRLGVGVGEASCAPAANSLIGDLFPPRRRALALSIFMLGLPLGTFLCYRLSGLIASAYTWRHAFYFACIPGLILGLLALKLPEPVRGATEEKPLQVSNNQRSPFWQVLAIPTILWIIASGALHNFNMYAINSFLPAFLMRTHLLSLKEATNVSSIVLGAVGILGLLGGGWVADRWSRRRKDAKLLLSALCCGLAAPCIYLALNQPPGDTLLFMLLMGTGIMLMFVYYSGVYASIQEVIPANLRGTAMALYFFAMYLLGASFGPVITGLLSDHYARRAMQAAGAVEMSEQFKAIGLHHAMYIIPTLGVALAVVLFAASRTVKKDIEKMQVN